MFQTRAGSGNGGGLAKPALTQVRKKDTHTERERERRTDRGSARAHTQREAVRQYDRK